MVAIRFGTVEKSSTDISPGVADQNNTESSFIQYDIEFGGEGVSFDQRKMNAVRAVGLEARIVKCSIHL